MRYRLPADRLTNQLSPHYLSGRKILLFIQSLLHPLQTLNDRFVKFAKEKKIEAAMTSQVFYFEWYLNRVFGKYLSDPQERIYLSEISPLGVDIYHENAEEAKPFTLWYESEQVSPSKPEEGPRELYYIAEEKTLNKVNFTVCVPRITIPQQEFVYMLSHVVNRYKVAGKTYLIKIDAKEINPL